MSHVDNPTINIWSDNSDGWRMISFHGTLPASENLMNIAGNLIWISAIAIGFWALFTIKEHFALRLTLEITLT